MIFSMTYYQICWYFLFYSFCGWVLEVIFHAVALGKIVNRGFLNGPVCPVYGFGALAVFSLTGYLQQSELYLNDFWLSYPSSFHRMRPVRSYLSCRRALMNYPLKISGNNLWGQGRFLYAFPSLKHRDHPDIIRILRERKEGK